MWFIVALLVGTPFFIKVFSDLSKEKAFDRQYMEKQIKDGERKSEWLKRVTDEKLEAELEQMIEDARPHIELPGETMTPQEKHAVECYKTVFNDWKRCCDELPFFETVTSALDPGSIMDTRRFYVPPKGPYFAEILRVMMALRGKLMRNEAETGIHMNFPSGNTKIQELRSMDNHLEFALWVNERLKEHGVDEEFYFYEFGTAYRGEAARHRFNGSMRWAPIIPTGTKISDERLPTTYWDLEDPYTRIKRQNQQRAE